MNKRKLEQDFFYLERNGIDWQHLIPFALDLPNPDNSKPNIRVRISFSSHVYSTKTVSLTEQFDFKDENQNKRSFCPTRYELSKSLPEICIKLVQENGKTWEERDRNRSSNLAAVPTDTSDGPHYFIVFQLYPSLVDGLDVEMRVKSAYTKTITFSNHKRRYKGLRNNIKTCFYKNKSIP